MERMRAWAIAVILALAGVAACTQDPSIEPPPSAGPACDAQPDVERGTSTHEFEVAGETRSFTLHVPVTYEPAEASPVMFTFHGLGGNGRDQAVNTGLTDVADTEGFVLVSPDGRGQPRGWNLTVPADDPNSELAFVSELVDQVDRLVCVDPDRRYATGHSNGSVMAFAIVCLTDVDVAAIAGMGALVSTEYCENDRQIPWLYIHALDDPIVPFAGGSSPVGDLGPVALNLGTWAEQNGCEPEGVQTERDGGIEVWSWDGCAVPAEALIADTGGHFWPTDELTYGTGLDAGVAMWAFFESLDDA